MILIKIPAKVNLYGEYLVTQGYQGSAACINKYLIAKVELNSKEVIIYNNKIVDLLYDETDFRTKCKIEIIQNDIPIGKGLGSSSVYFLLIATAHLYLENKFNKVAAFNLALKLERQVNPSYSGIDTASILAGGLILYQNEVTTKYPSILFEKIYLLDTGIIHNYNNCKNLIDKKNKDSLIESSKNCFNKLLNQDKNFFIECLNYYNILKNIIPIETEQMKIFYENYKVKSTGYGCGGIMYSINNFNHQKKEIVKIDESGLLILDQRYSINNNYLLNKINFNKPNIGDIGIASAPSNIALLKYWGKEEECLQIATNPSISMTIPGFRSFTKLICCQGYKKPVTQVETFLAKLIDSDKKHLKIETYNNFPSNTGIASSASGYAAIVLAYSNMVKDFNMEKIFHWARIGSGSACRSLLENQNNLIKQETIVAWDYNQIYKVNTNLKLNHILVIFNPFPKEISSTDGHLLAKESPLFEIRKKMAKENFNLLIKAFQDNDFKQIMLLTENDTLITHSIMKDTYLNFLSSKIQTFISQFIEFRNNNKLNALFTLDAGQNVHIIFEKNYGKKIKSFLNYYPCVALIESNKIDYKFSFNHNEIKLFNNITFYRKCILISGKRYSGKTFLSNKLNQELKYPIFSISDEIKEMYCQENKLDYDNMVSNRNFKEKHRLNMIKYAEDKMKKDKFFWCKKLWDTIPNNCRVFILSDARRINDSLLF
jgi:diphosphomevalonate decarboxylase